MLFELELAPALLKQGAAQFRQPDAANQAKSHETHLYTDYRAVKSITLSAAMAKTLLCFVGFIIIRPVRLPKEGMMPWQWFRKKQGNRRLCRACPRKRTPGCTCPARLNSPSGKLVSIGIWVKRKGPSCRLSGCTTSCAVS